MATAPAYDALNPFPMYRYMREPNTVFRDPTSGIWQVLRYRSPVQFLARIAIVDTIVGGQQVKAGELVTANLGSANRDEVQFPDPDRFDIRRSPNRHLAFGHGIHFCLGAPLARLEAKIALTLLLERFQDIQLDCDVALEAIGSSIVFGVKHLPITFQSR